MFTVPAHLAFVVASAFLPVRELRKVSFHLLHHPINMLTGGVPVPDIRPVLTGCLLGRKLLKMDVFLIIYFTCLIKNKGGRAKICRQCMIKRNRLLLNRFCLPSKLKSCPGIHCTGLTFDWVVMGEWTASSERSQQSTAWEMQEIYLKS